MIAQAFGIFGIVMALLLIIAAFLLRGKGSFLIAGYNTINKEEKEKYDQEKLCRFVGKLLVIIFFAIAFFPIGIYFEIYWVIYCGSAFILVCVIGAVIYMNTGNRFHKMDNSEINSFGSEKSKKTTKVNKIVSIVFSMIVLISVGGVLFYGVNEPVINVLDDSIQIKAMYGIDVDFSEVNSISLVEESMHNIGVGVRVNGFGGFGEALRGHFKSDSIGETLLFVHSTSSPTIRIERNSEKDIYISYRNSEKTEMLFNELSIAINP